MIHYIYLIENAKSEKFYIGRTSNPKRREWAHFSALRRGVHGNPRLQSAYDKHGPEALFFNVVDHTDEREIERLEAEWFAVFDHDKTYLYNCHFQTAGGMGVEKRDLTREYIFDIITERYETRASVRALAAKHKTSTATILSYVPEWEGITGLKMFDSPQVLSTKERVAKFVDEYRRIGREVNRNYRRFGVSHHALIKHLPSFGLTFDDVRLDGWVEESKQRALDAIAYHKKHGGKVCDVIAKFNTNVATFYKYRNQIA